MCCIIRENYEQNEIHNTNKYNDNLRSWGKCLSMLNFATVLNNLQILRGRREDILPQLVDSWPALHKNWQPIVAVADDMLT